MSSLVTETGLIMLVVTAAVTITFVRGQTLIYLALNGAQIT